jgi:hypothetical protein
MKRLEKLILGMVFTICVVLFGYLIINLSTPVQGAGTSDLGRMVTALGSVDYGGYQALAPNSTTASSLTRTSSTQEKAFITVETAPMRYKMHGVAPTTTEGHLLYPGDSITLNTMGQITGFRVISVSTHGKLQISYGR